jgi:hypothetical protein
VGREMILTNSFYPETIFSETLLPYIIKFNFISWKQLYNKDISIFQEPVYLTTTEIHKVLGKQRIVRIDVSEQFYKQKLVNSKFFLEDYANEGVEISFHYVFNPNTDLYIPFTFCKPIGIKTLLKEISI